MGLARGLERRLERLVDGLASRLFRGRIHPVELGTRLEREAELAAFETQAGPGAPNAFDVVLGGEPEPDEAVAAAAGELAAVMSQAAAERGWRLEGPVTVRISFGDGPASMAEVTASVEPGEIPPWAHLEAPHGRLPVKHNRCVIGRSASCDIHLPSEDVSRQHALLWREAGSVWLVDLGSSNGTLVNGDRYPDVVDLIDGDRIDFAGTITTLRLV
jgi:hypothetical protein